jgi:hypothetical protein
MSPFVDAPKICCQQRTSLLVTTGRGFSKMSITDTPCGFLAALTDPYLDLLDALTK